MLKSWLPPCYIEFVVCTASPALYSAPPFTHYNWHKSLHMHKSGEGGGLSWTMVGSKKCCVHIDHRYIFVQIDQWICPILQIVFVPILNWYLVRVRGGLSWTKSQTMAKESSFCKMYLSKLTNEFILHANCIAPLTQTSMMILVLLNVANYVSRLSKGKL